MSVRSAKQLIVDQRGFELAIQVFEVSKRFRADERFSLASQIRRSSRSICLNLREAWAKRRCEAHFTSKLTDCDGENGETDSSLDFVLSCHYVDQQTHLRLTGMCDEIGKMLGGMMRNPTPFRLTPDP